MERNLKRIEHHKRCRLCADVAQLHKGRRYYCAACYYAVYQMPPVTQDPTNLTTGDLVAALNHGAITGRAGAEILDRILKERTV